MTPNITYLTNPSNESVRLALTQKLSSQQAANVLVHVPIEQQIAAYGQVISGNFGLESTHRFDVKNAAGYNQARKLIVTGVFDKADKITLGQAFSDALREQNSDVVIPATWVKDQTQAFDYVKLMAASHNVAN